MLTEAFKRVSIETKIRKLIYANKLLDLLIHLKYCRLSKLMLGIGMVLCCGT